MIKGIFCLVLNLTTTCTDGKWAVIWPPIFATRYVSFATNFTLGSKYLLLLTLIVILLNASRGDAFYERGGII